MTDPYSKGGEPRHHHTGDCYGVIDGRILCGLAPPFDPDPLMQWDDSDGMCPNCVSPWKCNGPHLAELTPYNRRHAESPRRSVVIPLILASVVGVGLLALWVAVKW